MSEDGTGEGTDPEADVVRLLSFNLRYQGIDQAPEWDWERRRESVASTIRFHRPDVVCLQECWQDMLGDLRERLPAFEFYGERAAGGEHTPVGYRTARFDCEAADVFAVSETPDELGSVAWNANYPRFTTHLHLTDRRTGRELLAASTHLDDGSARARLEGARLHGEWLADREVEAVALAGDFNCVPDSPPYEYLTTEAGLADARSVADVPDHGPDVTYVGLDPDDPEERQKRIDYAFVSPAVDVVRTGVCADVDARMRYPSDHLPVVADLVVGGGDDGGTGAE